MLSKVEMKQIEKMVSENPKMGAKGVLKILNELYVTDSLGDQVRFTRVTKDNCCNQTFPKGKVEDKGFRVRTKGESERGDDTV